MKTHIIIPFLFLSLLPMAALTAQPMIDPSTYGSWELCYNEDVSNNGAWVSYLTRHAPRVDTLFLRQTEGDAVFAFAQGSAGRFTRDSQYFTAMTAEGQVAVVNLGNLQKKALPPSGYPQFTFDDRFLLALRDAEGGTALLVHSLATGHTTTLPQVVAFLPSPTDAVVALIVQDGKGAYGIQQVDLATYTQQTIADFAPGRPCSLVWSEDGSTLAFLRDTEHPLYTSYTLNRYRDGRSHSLGPVLTQGGPVRRVVNTPYLRLSTTGAYVFFESTDQQALAHPEPDTGVQVWDTEDPMIYPQRKVEGLMGPQAYRWVWQPDRGTVRPLTEHNPSGMRMVGRDRVLTYEGLPYEPQYTYRTAVDVYLHDLDTGTQALLLERISPDFFFARPDRAQVVYFKGEDWWCYDVCTGTHRNLTRDIPSEFRDKGNDQPSKQVPYSKRIKWIVGERAILVNDAHDVWKLYLDGGMPASRLTDAKRDGKTYRLFIDYTNPKNLDPLLVDLSQGFVVRGEDADANSGYFLWQEEKSLVDLGFGAHYVDQVHWDTGLQHITWRAQAYNMPPLLMHYDRKRASSRVVATTNASLTLRDWGTPTLVHYLMPDGSKGKAQLIYPADYDPSRTYPMVVEVYERLTEWRHEFFPPDWCKDDGFNPTHYALDGYFVLRPDIAYALGNPGLSALHCVEAAVVHVLERYPIAPERVGLIGHSHGGYEAAFIATQTDRFAAVVAGAAVTDMVGFYRAINTTTGKEEMWRLEDYQIRMGGPYWDLKEAYEANSPFHHVEKLETPLLLWSGAKDYHIDFQESLRFYLAMRRLQKEGQLLLFENEGHSIVDPTKSKYLAMHAKQWLDRYCKP